MPDEKEGCQKPDQLKGKPQECSPEQIRMCHGDVKKHPCITENPVEDEKRE